MSEHASCPIFPTDDGVAVVSKPCQRCGDDQGAAVYIRHPRLSRRAVQTPTNCGVEPLDWDGGAS